jgi:hypothetical protein
VKRSNEFVDLLHVIYPEGSPFTLQNTQRVNFVSPPGTCSQWGDSQNMAYFELVTQEGQRRCFLSDVVAYYYHDVWAKTFEGSNRADLITLGKVWLNEVPKGNWQAR